MHEERWRYIYLHIVRFKKYTFRIQDAFFKVFSWTLFGLFSLSFVYLFIYFLILYFVL